MFLADRVHVMSPRPGRVSATIEIDLPRPRTLELEESAAFGEYESRLREALRAGSAGNPGAATGVITQTAR